MQEVIQLVYIVLELIIACLAVAGNVLVCWAVYLNSNLQSVTNFFVVSLAVADVAVGLLAIPFAIAIRYNSLVTGQRAKGVMALCWVLSTGIGLTPMLGWNKGWNSTAGRNECSEGLTRCLFEGVVTLDYMVYFNFFGCVLVPLLVMLIIYVHIFMAARRQLRLKVAHTPSPGAAAASPSSSRSTLQKEVHAAKSLAIIVGLFVVCWFPLHIINCFNNLCEDCGRPHVWVMNVAIILSHANSVVNPLIYAYRIREFRLTFRRILYQHILGKRDAQGFGVGNNRAVVSNSTLGSSDCSKNVSSCVTVVNSYILDSAFTPTTPKATHETCGQWTSKFNDAPSSNMPNEHQTQNSTVSAMQQQKCIMGLVLQDGLASHMWATNDVSLVKDSESCITYANVHAVSAPQNTQTRHEKDS
ncbi:adenosine A2a receptor b isoform X2 [Betta splendens]|uniref:Adenosine A2a receptor b isoform X2 n=1 Tax=Betta splendens TaxID=158456 RepID=A0A9W2Y5I2_BETSP|nr:adenosine A2a receptor b isoform X2 [Betta splendens]